MKSGGILGMDNTEIRRRRRNRRRARNIRVGLTLFTICIVAIAISVVRGILRKPAQITIQVADVEIKQGEQLPAYSADIKIRDKDRNKLTKDYTAEDFAKDLKKGKNIIFLSKADANTEGTYVIIAKLNSNIKKNLEGDWKKKVQVTIKNGTCKVKNPTGVWEGNKFKKYDGTYITSDFVVSKGNTYYFDSDGKKVTGWQMIEGALYCFDNKGIMQRSGWVAKDDGKAYLTDEGKALTGWQTINEKEYYFDSKGIVATGEVKIGLEKCKFNEKGELISKEKVAIDPKKPMIALTFDDGPGPRTSELLNQLKKYNAHATFFMLGKNVKLYPDAVKQMLKDGNELGNHSYDHQQLTKIDGAAVKKEVDDTNRNIKNICGSPATLLRPPYGAINDTVKSNVGMPMILWNVDTLDWKTRNTQSTIDSVMKNLKDGDIVLMHDIHSQTIDAALELIPKLEEEGYQLVTVSEMAAAKKQDLKDGTAYSDFTN